MKLRKKYIREYRIWKGMRSRCNAPCFSNSTYQKKGIKYVLKKYTTAGFLVRRKRQLKRLLGKLKLLGRGVI